MFQFSSLWFYATRVTNFFFRRTAWFFSVVTACNLNTEILHTIKNKPFKETWTCPSLIERIVEHVLFFRQLKICQDRFPNLFFSHQTSLPEISPDFEDLACTPLFAWSIPYSALKVFTFRQCSLVKTK